MDAPKLTMDKAARNYYQQRKAGGYDRLSDDVGGHLLASMFGGAGEAVNIVAMNKQLNGNSHAFGAFGRIEMRWTKEIVENSADVAVNIKPIYSGSSLRSVAFDIVEKVTKNGEIIENRYTYENVPGG